MVFEVLRLTACYSVSCAVYWQVLAFGRIAVASYVQAVQKELH